MCSYLRVKRRNQTFCFLCEDTDTVLDVKRKVYGAVSQHAESQDRSSGDSSNGDGGPSSAESLQLLLPADPKQQQQDDDQGGDDDDDDDEEMMDDNDNNNNRRRRKSSFLKDEDTLGSVRGKTAMKNKEEESELVLHVVFPVADNEWESVDVAPTVIQDS